jgi:hypothetical protein
MLAVTITASSRAAGGQARVVSLAPTTASARQRSRVAVLTPNRRARSVTGALSGGRGGGCGHATAPGQLEGRADQLLHCAIGPRGLNAQLVRDHLRM